MFGQDDCSIDQNQLRVPFDIVYGLCVLSYVILDNSRNFYIFILRYLHQSNFVDVSVADFRIHYGWKPAYFKGLGNQVHSVSEGRITQMYIFQQQAQL